MADTFQGEISNLLHRNNLFSRHEKAIPKTVWQGGKRVVVGYNSDARATPDLVGGNSRQIFVEVKTGKSNRFNFSKWELHQRQWAKEYREIYGVEYWIGLVMKTKHSPHRVKRVAFVIPYPKIIEVEELLKPVQSSINYLAVKGSRKILQENKWDAAHLWKEFALDWIPKVGWGFPDNHPFRTMYLDAKPYLYEDVLTKKVEKLAS